MRREVWSLKKRTKRTVRIMKEFEAYVDQHGSPSACWLLDALNGKLKETKLSMLITCEKFKISSLKLCVLNSRQCHKVALLQILVINALNYYLCFVFLEAHQKDT